MTFKTKASYEAALAKKGQNLGSRYLDIQFVTKVLSGGCCGGGAIDAGVMGIEICGYESLVDCS